jgi:hypothetical protein
VPENQEANQNGETVHGAGYQRRLTACQSALRSQITWETADLHAVTNHKDKDRYEAPEEWSGYAHLFYAASKCPVLRLCLLFAHLLDLL